MWGLVVEVSEDLGSLLLLASAYNFRSTVTEGQGDTTRLEVSCRTIGMRLISRAGMTRRELAVTLCLSLL